MLSARGTCDMDENTSPLLTVAEFASMLRIKPSCVRRWIREEKVTVVHVGRLVRIPCEEVLRIIHQGTRQRKNNASA